MLSPDLLAALFPALSSLVRVEAVEGVATGSLRLGDLLRPMAEEESRGASGLLSGLAEASAVSSASGSSSGSVVSFPA